MTFYQAVCQNGDFESSFFQREGDAVKAANKHIKDIGGTHIVRIDEVFVPNTAANIVSSRNITLS